MQIGLMQKLMQKLMVSTQNLDISFGLISFCKRNFREQSHSLTHKNVLLYPD